MTRSFATARTSRLSTDVQFLKGVGPERAALLAKLNLRTAADILFQFPRSYQNMSQVRAIADLEERVAVSVCGVVEEIEQRTTQSGNSMVGILLRDESEALRATWYNQPFVRKRFRRGSQVMLSGEPRRAGLRWEMVHPKIQSLEGDQPPQQGEIIPIYPLTEGLKQSHMRRIVAGVLDEYLADVEEVLPSAFLDAHGLLPIHRALAQIHFPTNEERLQAARRRFIFQELLVLQLALAIRRRQFETLTTAPAIEASTKIDARIRRLFGWPLTPGQEQAVREISQDLARTIPMNRLLQGDVGSGKTLVAVYAMLTAVAHGFQAALMAPTEVLARQHFDTLTRTLRQARVRVALWTGGMTPAERRATQIAVSRGEIDLVVGTQALVQSECNFANLGLVVIDEQHKFGVLQRARLREAGTAPHYLVMTATPIPRTIAMTAYGDLDVSTLRDHPPGRQPVHSYLVADEFRERWWEFFRKQLRDGRQGFVVTPRLQEAEQDDVLSLQEAFESLCNGELEAFRLDLIHGRMSAAEKQQSMSAFRRGDTQVLVATSVIEVGIDVPNVAVMTIENAERFGLAQLHQLRGRVGRGEFPGYVGLFTSTKDEERRARLQAFVDSQDGFALAELDFATRGPGDLLGTRQHGLPPLRIADFQRDQQELVTAREIARQLVADESIKQDEFLRLRRQVVARYGNTYQLGDVGSARISHKRMIAKPLVAAVSPVASVPPHQKSCEKCNPRSSPSRSAA